MSSGYKWPLTKTAPGEVTPVGFKDASTGKLVIPIATGGALSTTPAAAGTATHTNVSALATSQQLLAANASRLGLSFYNDSSSGVFIKFGVTASASSFVRYLLPNDFWIPSILYTGRVDAIWDSAAGTMRIVEYSA